MKNRTHYPPKEPPCDDGTCRPTVFLAGPIKNAPEWQFEAIKVLHTAVPEVDIACPRTPGTWHGKYDAQVKWETSELWHAGMNGVVLFWLADSISETPGRCYAQTSRFELGEWMTKLLNPFYTEFSGLSKSPPRLVIGIEPGFSNEKYIRLRAREMYPGFMIYDTLEDTLAQVVKLLRNEYGTDKEMSKEIDYDAW